MKQQLGFGRANCVQFFALLLLILASICPVSSINPPKEVTIGATVLMFGDETTGFALRKFP